MKREKPPAASRRPPRILLLSWFALLVLLGATVSLSCFPLGAFNMVAALNIALVKGLIVAAVFMALRDERPLTIAFAAAGFYWLGIMFWLTFADYVTRTNFPNSSHLL